MRLVTIAVVCLWHLGAVAGEIRALHAALGEQGRHYISLPIGNADQQTLMPITVIVGKAPGPTLLVLAGVHGSEHSPIVAGQRLAGAIEPAAISGKVILVHIANMPAYLGRSIYINPADGKNLNRVFPGKADGTLSEQIAFTLTEHIYPLADAVLDMHSGDGNEDLRPMWVGYYGKAGGQQVIERSRAMAMAFGFEHVVEFQWELTDRAAAIWAGSAAIALGIPSIDVEAGGMNVVDEDTVAAIQTGVWRTMAHLGMTEGKFPPIERQTVIRERSWISAPRDGSWIALKSAGERVEEGELLGYLTDWHGRKVFEAHAPHAGLLLLTLTAPPVRNGETVAIVAKLSLD